MKYRNISSTQAQQRIESYHRGFQIHKHTFSGLRDYSSENTFWVLTGAVLRLIVTPLAWLIALIITGLLKLVYR